MNSSTLFQFVSHLKSETLFLNDPISCPIEYFKFLNDHLTWKEIESRIFKKKYIHLDSFVRDLKKPLVQYLVWNYSTLANNNRRKIYQLLDDISLLLQGKLHTAMMTQCRVFLESLHRDSYYTVFGMDFDFRCYSLFYEMPTTSRESSLLDIAFRLENHVYSNGFMFCNDLLYCVRQYKKRVLAAIPTLKHGKKSLSLLGLVKTKTRKASALNVVKWMEAKIKTFRHDVSNCFIPIEFPSPTNVISTLLLHPIDLEPIVSSLSEPLPVKELSECIKATPVWFSKPIHSMVCHLNGSNVSKPTFEIQKGQVDIVLPSSLPFSKVIPLTHKDESKYSHWIKSKLITWLTRFEHFDFEDLQDYWNDYSGWESYTPFFDMMTHSLWPDFVKWFQSHVIELFEREFKTDIDFLLYWKRFPNADLKKCQEEFEYTRQSKLVALLLEDVPLGTWYSKHIRSHIKPFIESSLESKGSYSFEKVWKEFRQLHPFYLNFQVKNPFLTPFIKDYPGYMADPLPLLYLWKKNPWLEYKEILGYFIYKMYQDSSSEDEEETEDEDEKRRISFRNVRGDHYSNWMHYGQTCERLKKSRLSNDDYDVEYSRRCAWYSMIEKCASKILTSTL